MDLLLAIIFCYQLHRMAVERDLSPWPFVLNFVAGFFFLAITVVYGGAMIFGADAFTDEKKLETLMYLSPFNLLFEVILFLYLRRRIVKTKVVYEEDDTDDTTPTDGPTEKKDLSYFR